MSLLNLGASKSLSIIKLEANGPNGQNDLDQIYEDGTQRIEIQNQ